MREPTDAGGTDSAPSATAFATSEVGSVAVVAIHGDLDLTSAPRLGETLDRLHANGAQGIVVDLRECLFIDSNGLAALLHSSGARQRPPEVAVVCAGGGAVARLLELTAIDQTLRVFDDVAAAASALA